MKAAASRDVQTLVGRVTIVAEVELGGAALVDQHLEREHPWPPGETSRTTERNVIGSKNCSLWSYPAKQLDK
jgi:hypothetical protein